MSNNQYTNSRKYSDYQIINGLKSGIIKNIVNLAGMHGIEESTITAIENTLLRILLSTPSIRKKIYAND